MRADYVPITLLDDHDGNDNGNDDDEDDDGDKISGRKKKSDDFNPSVEAKHSSFLKSQNKYHIYLSGRRLYFDK